MKWASEVETYSCSLAGVAAQGCVCVFQIFQAASDTSHWSPETKRKLECHKLCAENTVVNGTQTQDFKLGEFKVQNVVLFTRNTCHTLLFLSRCLTPNDIHPRNSGRPLSRLCSTETLTRFFSSSPFISLQSRMENNQKHTRRTHNWNSRGCGHHNVYTRLLTTLTAYNLELSFCLTLSLADQNPYFTNKANSSVRVYRNNWTASANED